MFVRLSLFCILVVLFSCNNSTHTEDIIVIGGGLMGSSTAWEISKNGSKVLLIEQQDSSYQFGSSFGEARISRSLGPKNDIFSYLQQSSVAETKILINYLNESNTSTFHSMEDIYSTSPITYIRYNSQLADVVALIDGQQDTFQFAPNPEMAMDMFQMQIPDSAMIIREFKKYSGTLNPKILICKLHQGINKAGNKIWYNTKVTKLKKNNSNFEIELTDLKTGEQKIINAKQLVLAAGPYNPELLSEIAPYFKQLIIPQRLFLSFFKIDKNAYDNYTPEQKLKIQNFYPMADFRSDLFYSMIEKKDEDGIPIIKVGGHLLRTDIKNLDEVWKKDLSAEEIAWSKNNTLRYFKMLNIPLDTSNLSYHRGYSCVYSLTESEVPYVTNLYDIKNELDPNLILVGGMSGIGAKGSLAYGLIAANLLFKKDDPSYLYQKTKKALGIERLIQDLKKLKLSQ